MPDIIQRKIAARFAGVGELGFKAIAATDELQRDGFALQMPDGADISRLQSGRAALLLNHDQIVGKIARAWFEPHRLMFEGQFPPAGVDLLADRQRKLLKAGVLNSCSLSFLVQDVASIPGGKRATKWTALEVSLCAVPVDAGAFVTERAHRAGKVLSAANTSALQEAHDLAEQCRGNIANVLAGAAPNDNDGDEGARAQDYRKRQRQLDVIRLASPPDLEWVENRARLEAELRDPVLRRRAIEKLRKTA